jgi:mRNA interferase HigB
LTIYPLTGALATGGGIRVPPPTPNDYPANELARRHSVAKPGLDAWFHEVEDADWANPAQVRAQYATASILRNGRVVFNIGGNKYRLVVGINYTCRVVYVRFAGTHSEYNQIDAGEI